MVKMTAAQPKTVGDDRQERDGVAPQGLSGGRRTLYFTRSELNQLLGLYSRNVMRGVWRDYAIDHRDGQALFSVFRHTHESAAYTIVKSGHAGGSAGVHGAERPPAPARRAQPARGARFLPARPDAGSGG